MKTFLRVVPLLLIVIGGCSRSAARRAQQFIASGDHHAAAGDLAAADIEYRNAIKAAPSSIEAHRRLLDVAVRRHESNALAREVFALAQLVPGDPVVQMRAGELYFQMGRFAEAEHAFTQAAGADPSRAAAHRALALLYMRRRRPAEAERQWEAVARSPECDPFALADFHAAQGKLDEAEGELRRLLDSAANSDAARLRLARVLYRNGRRREAVQILDVVLKHDARNVTPWLVRGQLRLADHQPDAAANAYAAALHIDPTSIEAATALTAIDLGAKRVQIAVARVKRLLVSSPDAVPMRLLAGRMYESIGQYGEAERHLTRAIQLEPSNLDAYTLLGRVYIRQSRMADARQQFARLAEQQPENPSAATMIGMLFEAEGRPADAQAHYEQLLATNPRAGVAANNLACLYLRQGRLDEALRWAKVAKQELVHVPQASDTLGWIYVQKKQPNEALPLLSEALERQPENAEYHFHLGMAYAGTGAVVQARSELTQ